MDALERALADASARATISPEAVTAALTAYGEAWAAASSDAAPVGLPGVRAGAGALKRSVRYVPVDATHGYLEMLNYGDIVGEGIPGAGVTTMTGRTVSVRPLSTRQRAVTARARYQARVGRVVEHPNPFYLRALQAPAVQEVVRQFPHLLFRRGPG